MPTSVHLPLPLLTAVDRRARRLGISRNRLIIHALERELTGGDDWPAGFFDQLRNVDDQLAGAADQLIAGVRARRTSKPPRRL